MRFSLRSWHARNALISCAGAMLLLTVACTTTRAVTADDLGGPNRPKSVKLTEVDEAIGRRTTIILTAPKVVGDTLFGVEDGVPQKILLADVTTMSATKGSFGKTALLVLGAGAGAFLYWDVAVQGTAPPTGMPGCCPACNHLLGYENGVPIYYC